MTEDNNRIRERVPFSIEAVFTHAGIAHTCKCENVSMGGLLLDCNEFLSVGDIGEILIILNSGTELLEVKGMCKVVRVVPAQGDRFLLGLEFESLDSESSIVLYNMVRYQTVQDSN